MTIQAETFLQFSRRTHANQGTRVRTAPAYRRSDPPTASWAEYRAYLVTKGASPEEVQDAKSTWRAWERQQARTAQLELDL